ncbi:hypothetical protein WN943_004491 [Citrus x changshan-huyou]
MGKKKKIQCLLNWLVKLLGFPYNGRRFPATGDTTAASRRHGGDQGRSRPAAESVVVSCVRPEFEMGKDYCLGSLPIQMGAVPIIPEIIGQKPVMSKM